MISDEERGVLAAAKWAETLQKTEDWTRYMEFLQKLQLAQLSQLATPSADVGGVLRTEYQKGTVYGLSLATTAFDETIAQAKEIRLREEALDPEDDEAGDGDV